MKKIIISIILALSILIACVPAYADSADSRDITFDSTEEILVDKDLITDFVIETVKDYTKKDITENDIDFSRAVRMYVNIEDERPSLEDIKYLEEEKCYYYELPVYAGGYTISFLIDLGKEISDEARELLDEEDMKWIEDRIGKWYPFGYSIYEGMVDYKEYTANLLKENGIDKAKVHFAEYWVSYYESEKSAICDTEDGEVVFDLWDSVPHEDPHYRGWIYQDGTWCYVREDGSYASNCWEYIYGEWYYFNEYSEMQTGWIKVKGKWYYLSSAGAMKTGWLKDKGKWYYLSSNGDMKTGWVKVKGKWYYLSSNGAMNTGWVKIKGSWYYLDSSGVMASNKWIGKYYVNSSGKWTKTA